MSNTPNYRLPVPRAPSQPPAPLWQQAAPVVARGAALVAAGIIAEWMLRSATRKAVALPFKGGTRQDKGRAIAKREPAETVSYSETIIVQRTVVRDRRP